MATAIRWLRCSGWFVLLIVAAGCSAKPRAPAILDEPVYQNSQEGFRFVPPEDWKMRSRAEVPSGPLAQERLLVEYKRLTGEKPAALEVSMADVAAEKDVADCVRDRGEPGGWKPVGEVERLEVGGRVAARVVFASQSGAENSHKEVVAVRRGSRACTFSRASFHPRITGLKTRSARLSPVSPFEDPLPPASRDAPAFFLLGSVAWLTLRTGTS